MKQCPMCGGQIIGDGLHSPLRCENYELPDGVEADSGPWYCEVTSEKWTKGPWIIEFCNCDEEGVLEEAEFTGAIMDKEGKDIAHVHNESNAHLIAAAPDMYEALLKCVAADPTIVTNRPGWMDYVASIEGARAALKKARCES